jgi:hypothetical protein
MTDNTNPSPTFPSLEEYLDKLIAEKDFPKLDASVKEQIKFDLRDRLNDFLNAKFIALLSDEKVEELNSLLAKNPQTEEVNQFFHANIPNLPIVISSELLNFRKSYLGIK